jgi:uncharacterized protein (TIGR02996 family)
VRAVNEEAGFIAAMLADPEDRTVLFVYADWLDEHNDPRGEYLRLILEGSFAGERLRRFIELSVGIDYRWRELIATRHWQIGDSVHIPNVFTRGAEIIAISVDRSHATVEIRRGAGDDATERLEFPLGILQRPVK